MASPARVQLVQQHTLPTLQPREIKLKQPDENEAHSITVEKEDTSDSDEEDNTQNKDQIPIDTTHETINHKDQPPDASSPASEDLQETQLPKLIPNKKKNKTNKKASAYRGSNSRVYPKAGNYVFIKSKDDDSENWTRIKIWQCVTKGINSLDTRNIC